MRVLPRVPGALALVAALGLSACATYEPAYGRLPFPVPGDVYGRPGDHRSGDYRATAEWRRVDGDAARYAQQVDRAIGLNNAQARSVERVVRDRARDLLQRTSARDHRHVYPFPRDERNATTRRWWSDTDRAVERVLPSNRRDAYRRFVRGDYYGRDGGYDRGGNAPWYYPGRQYEQPDDRYRRDDDRYRREDARRRQEEIRRDQAEARRRQAQVERQRQEEARRRQEMERRRQEEIRREQQEEARRRRDAERQRQEAERRRQQDERQRGRAGRTDDRDDDRGNRRITERRDDDRNGRGRDARPQRRGGD